MKTLFQSVIRWTSVSVWIPQWLWMKVLLPITRSSTPESTRTPYSEPVIVLASTHTNWASEICTEAPQSEMSFPDMVMFQTSSRSTP